MHTLINEYGEGGNSKTGSNFHADWHPRAGFQFYSFRSTDKASTYKKVIRFTGSYHNQHDFSCVLSLRNIRPGHKLLPVTENQYIQSFNVVIDYFYN